MHENPDNCYDAAVLLWNRESERAARAGEKFDIQSIKRGTFLNQVFIMFLEREGWFARRTGKEALIRNFVDWIEVAQITYDNTDNGTAPEAVVVIGGGSAGPQIADDLDAALADNTIIGLPLGDRLRLRTTVAGATAPTYNYSVRAAFQN